MNTSSFQAHDVPNSVAERVASEIREEIHSGRLEPGVRIGTKRDLRLRFGVAVATINEAVRLLEARGEVRARPGPGGGVFVTSPSSRVQLRNLVLGFRADATAMADCLAIRNALELLICEDAARSEESPAKLQEILERMNTSNVSDYLHENWEFHRQIAKMAPNETLGAIYIMLLNFVEEGLNRVEATASFRPAKDLAVHREIADAIASRDRKRIRAAVRRHAPTVDRILRELHDELQDTANPRAT